MRKAYSILFIVLSFVHQKQCVQPYFPPQALFFAGSTLYAIDEINQKAYKSVSDSVKSSETAYAMKNFPYAPSDSPQSQYYVQLQDEYPDIGCRYETYWEYGGSSFNAFPQHWNDGATFEIKNFIDFEYSMLYSNKSSAFEDYWYSNETCHPMGKRCPCEEIFFRKGTNIPERSTKVIHTPWEVMQVTTDYLFVTIGKPDDKYFDPIIQNWWLSCRDVMLGVVYHPNISKILLNQTAVVLVSLSTPPHKVNGNDSLRIQWDAIGCVGCIFWEPATLYFTAENFSEPQSLTIKRIKIGSKTVLIPKFDGGGFNLVPPHDYTVSVE